jgi:alkaline phosphatase
LSASNFDFFGGGSFKKAKGKDGEISAYDLARQQGYTLTNTRETFDKLKKGDNKVFASGSITEGSGALRYAIDQTEEDIPLEDFVAKAIELLDNEKGFFIMCEEGKIDWAAHSNDGATMLKNVVSLSVSVDKALDFYNKHPDETLIIITADHETGGFALGSAKMKYDSDFALLDHQEISAQAFTSIADSLFSIPANLNLGYAMQLVEDYFGMGDDAAIPLSPYEKTKLEEAFFVSAGMVSPDNELAYKEYGGNHPLAVTATEILNNKAGLAWTTWSHTGVPVPVYAIGAGAEAFIGFYDNTDIPKKIAHLMNIDFNE